MKLAPGHNARWLWVSALVVALDQTTKFWIMRLIPNFGGVAWLPHLNLVHRQNTGAAFSMMNQAPAMVFIGLSLVVSVGIIGWLFKHPRDHRIVAAGFVLILGGALGNALDRIRVGYVTDFIDFYVGDWHFAAFNVADSAITVGAGLLILDMLIENWRRRGQAPDTAGKDQH